MHTTGQTNEMNDSKFEEGKSIHKSLEDDICEMLRSHEDIDTSNVQVDVRSEEVFLEGYVPEESMKSEVEHLVKDHSPDLAITNLLRVKLNETIFP